MGNAPTCKRALRRATIERSFTGEIAQKMYIHLKTRFNILKNRVTDDTRAEYARLQTLLGEYIE